MTKPWHPDSWQSFPINQQPAYADLAVLGDVETRLRTLPPLVSIQQIDRLSNQLGSVALGKAFLMQGGDCAESFAEFSQANLVNFFRVLLQMAITLVHGVNVPVVKVGRIAGQFAKPRSTDTETKDGVELPAYRGDMVNRMEFSEDARRPDPQRLLDVYYQSAATLNYLRSLASEGFASLRNVQRWNSEFIANSDKVEQFTSIVQRIQDSITFVEACGIPLETSHALSQTELFTSHEALLLPYESALVRRDDRTGRLFAGSAHMLWIGDRTRQLNGAHVEFMRGITNPIGIKVGPSMQRDDLIRLIDILNPDDRAGRLTLISRMGRAQVETLLPPLVQAVKQEGRKVVWSCDPMHGNTIRATSGIKTRRFDEILAEVHSFFMIHKSLGTYPGGVHFEMTGQDVTECIGGSQAISAEDLPSRYNTHCDPRLNASQSLELAFLIAEHLKGD